MTPASPRLDILLYAHDGRGLGHVSRSVAIGMAVRRLYPALKICLLTGSRNTRELIGPAPLDWLKLPAYATAVVGGTSRGKDGLSGFTDRELGLHRAEQIRQITIQYRPRLILADHTPQGKHRELVPALQASAGQEKTTWLLGLRGVVGAVEQTGSPLARDLYRRYFSGLLWYGDSAVLGVQHRRLLGERFGAAVQECGYVSRLTELGRIVSSPPAEQKPYACTVSIPWFGEDTQPLLDALAKAIRRLGPGFGRFRLFLGDGAAASTLGVLRSMDWCSFEPFGDGYARALANSRTAMIYGGYNSLVDVLAIGLPSLVVMRSMQDREQQLHLEALLAAGTGHLQSMTEQDCREPLLYKNLRSLLTEERPSGLLRPVELEGAARAARYLAAAL